MVSDVSASKTRQKFRRLTSTDWLRLEWLVITVEKGMRLCTAGNLLEKALLSCGLRFQRSFTRKAKNTVVTRRKSTDMTTSPGLWLGTSWDHVPGSLLALFSIGQRGLLAVCCCEILRTGRSSLHFDVRVQRNGHALADVPFTAVSLLILHDCDTIIAVCHALMTVYHDLTEVIRTRIGRHHGDSSVDWSREAACVCAFIQEARQSWRWRALIDTFEGAEKLPRGVRARH